jgi:hypothetical protein
MQRHSCPYSPISKQTTAQSHDMPMEHALPSKRLRLQSPRRPEILELLDLGQLSASYDDTAAAGKHKAGKHSRMLC